MTRFERNGTPISVLGRVGLAGARFTSRRGLYLGRRSTKVHVALYRLTRGRVGSHLPGCPAAKILLLDHTGARTGARRTSPLMYHQECELVAVVASKAGQPTHPAWFHNLKANPRTTIQIGAEVRPVKARVATPTERARLWPQFVSFFPAYDFYQRIADGREIPIVILEPDRIGEDHGEHVENRPAAPLSG